MIRKIIKALIAVAITCYMLFALTVIPSFSNDGSCKGVLVELSDNSLEAISREDIIDILEKDSIDPSGKGMDEFLCRDIEEKIGEISLIKECQVYKSIGGYVNIEISCREPIIKIFDKNGEAYCMDSEGNIIYGIQKALHLPVASGYIEKESAVDDLQEVATAISRSSFWSAQIEQVYINEKKEIILIPRVGDHIIELGTSTDADKKLKKLYIFYTQTLNIVGWNKYNKINIEFADKIVCTKR